MNIQHYNQQKQEPPILPFTPPSPVEGEVVGDFLLVEIQFITHGRYRHFVSPLQGPHFLLLSNRVLEGLSP